MKLKNPPALGLAVAEKAQSISKDAVRSSFFISGEIRLMTQTINPAGRSPAG